MRRFYFKVAIVKIVDKSVNKVPHAIYLQFNIGFVNSARHN